MCIAIYRPSNVILTKALLKQSFLNNPDGWGIAFPNDKKTEMVVKRSVSGFRKFWKEYQEIPQEKPMLIHFRIATSGKINEANCHPFLIDKRHALIHNGSIKSKLNEECDTASDTALFVEKKLKPLFENFNLKKHFWASAAFKWMMEEVLGWDNKMVILSADGFEVIYNEKRGEWEHEAWFSNTSYKEDRKSINGKKIEIIEENGWKTKVITKGNGHKLYVKLEPIKPEPKTNLMLPAFLQSEAAHRASSEKFQKENKLDIMDIY